MPELYDEAMRKALLEEFLAENNEALRRLEGNLILLESDPGAMDLVHAVFRDMHTIKGNCRMLGFSQLEELLHAAESLLGLYREGRGLITREGAEVLFRVADTVSSLMPRVAQVGEEGVLDFSTLISGLERIRRAMEEESEDEEAGVAEAEEVREEPGVRRGVGSGEGQAVRLSIDRLDFLIDLIGQLGAASNQLRYEFDRNRERAWQVMEGMEGQLRQLQDEVLKYRLQPIGRVWEGYQRLVRDLAVETGKRIMLDVSGEATEVDRAILAVLKEVFGHVIRNAADHGLEPVAERLGAGKPPVGRIRLHAEQRHGQVYLEVGDDGRGMDPARLKAKGVEMGLITPLQAQEMGDAEALQLIFAPGFTTTAQVGRISGRGAGMDAVKAAVEKVRGLVEVTSTPGKGTVLAMRIPQTMAIVPALMVLCQGAWYGIPEAQVVELISFMGPEVARHVEGKMGNPMVRVRGGLVPLLPLESVFNSSGDPLAAVLGRSEAHVAVLQGEDGLFGLAVEAIGEIAHLVVKPLARVVASSGLFSGAVVMPDGRVSLLLDVVALGRLVAE